MEQMSLFVCYCVTTAIVLLLYWMTRVSIYRKFISGSDKPDKPTIKTSNGTTMALLDCTEWKWKWQLLNRECGGP